MNSKAKISELQEIDTYLNHRGIFCADERQLRLPAHLQDIFYVTGFIDKKEVHYIFSNLN